MSIFSPSAKPRNFYKIISLIFIFLLCNNTQAAQNAFDKELKHPPIPLLDEQGNHVLDGTHPYSPKKSCAGSGCHDYDAITSAYHFEMGRDEADDHYGEKRGLPHLSSPGYYGGYTCMGGNNQQVLAKKNNSSRQDFADYGSAGWVKTCMSCHAGGGWAEKDRNGIRYDEKDLTDVKPFDGDYYNRVTDPQTGEQRIEPWDWKKSGVSEADCLFCHTKFSKLSLPPNSGLSTSLSPIEARQALTAQDFFRQAPSGLLEYIKNTDRKHILNIARQEGDFVLNEQGLPIFNWNKEAFDDRGRVTLSMLRFPENENCMACHATSEFRRGFYGFGEAARQTLASIANGDDEEPGAGATLEDDYRDDIHKGTVFTADNGQKRTIESCNSCHSAQYYKPIFSNVDLSANHNFPKGNSDMDVRNDLDYKPNVLSCEQCHLKAVNAVFRKEYDSLLDSHRGGWKLKGDLSGYDEASLTQIVQTHFDSVACQTCHILNKTDADDNVLKLSYRYRLAEDGKTKISVYNPRLRYYWKDKTSGRVLFQHERNAVFKLATDGFGRPIGQIIDPISQQVLGKVSASSNNANATFRDPTSYEDYVALKTAYDSLLKNKGYKNANTTQVWIESNEYVISHNTRSAAESMPCLDCHARESNGNVSQLLSDNGLLGKNSKRTITTVPDNRLVTEGIISLGLAYNRLEKNGTITQSTYDILQVTKIDPFMSLLKNSSATEITGRFNPINTADLLKALDTRVANKLRPVLTHNNSFTFNVKKGRFNLRNMAVVINGSAVNNIIAPTFTLALGQLDNAERSAQDILSAKNLGRLQSNVFYLSILDSNKKPFNTLSPSDIVVNIAYKGSATEIDKINVIVANLELTTIEAIAPENILMLQPAGLFDDGFIIFKMSQPGYFIAADKR